MNEIETVHSDDAPRAIGPYSQAVITGDLVFTSGQIGIDPATSKLVGGGLDAQVERVLDNLTAILAAAGTSFENAVKITIYLADLSHFAELNEVYGRRLGDARPARATVQVSRLPMDALVEMDCVARL